VRVGFVEFGERHDTRTNGQHSYKLAFHDADTDTDFLASPDMPTSRENLRENVRVGVGVGVGIPA